MNSGIFRLNGSDLVKGGVTAVCAGAVLAVLSVLSAVFGAPDFDVFLIDWALVGRQALNAAIVGAQGGFSGYIVKNFLSDKDGKVLGAIG